MRKGGMGRQAGKFKGKGLIVPKQETPISDYL